MAPFALIDMRVASRHHRESAAQILVAALQHAPSAWKEQQSAWAEVLSFTTDPERLAILAIQGDSVLGWIGAVRHSEFAWELHPLAVRPESQRQGVGTELVHALETRARSEGVIAIWLGTDDDFGGTNLYGKNLYPDVLAALQNLDVTTGHPFRFYEKLGYSVTGVLPDVDGEGRHDILMAKRI